MPATEAQIAANRLNARKSTGPKTEEGKDASRGNAVKHGLRSKTVLPEREAAEVERRYVAFCEELQPSGEVGMALARQAAMMSVRSERCYDHENAVLTERVRRAEADVVPPEGCDEDEAERLRQEAGRRAMFDPSPEAALARRYEAEARRGFFRALKEFHALERAARRAAAGAIDEPLASIGRADLKDLSDDQLEQVYAEMIASAPPIPAEFAERFEVPAPARRVDVPITVGKRR